MKPIFTVYIKIIFCLLLITITILPSKIYSQTILVYSDHQPLEGMRTQFLNEVFFPAIEKESEGRLKIEAHWNGELAIAYEALDSVSSDNSVAMATVVPEYTAKELPIHQLFKSFPSGPFGKDQVTFFREAFSTIPQFKQELSKNNIIPIFLGTGYPVGFFSTSPIKDIIEIKDQKWRSASFWHLDFLKHLGAIPIRMHWGNEIYESLQMGKLNGIMVNIDSGYNLKVYEHAPYLLVSKNLWLGHLYMVTINKTVWNKLRVEDREAIERAASYAYAQLGNVMNNSYEAQINALKKLGVTVTYLSPSELNKLTQYTNYSVIQDNWVKQQEENNINDVTLVLQELRKLLQKFDIKK